MPRPPSWKDTRPARRHGKTHGQHAGIFNVLGRPLRHVRQYGVRRVAQERGPVHDPAWERRTDVQGSFHEVRGGDVGDEAPDRRVLGAVEGGRVMLVSLPAPEIGSVSGARSGGVQEDHVVELGFAHGVSHDVAAGAQPAGADTEVEVGEDFRFLDEGIAGDRDAVCGVASRGEEVCSAEVGSDVGSQAAMDAVCAEEQVACDPFP